MNSTHGGPVLVEPGVKYFFGCMLKQCNKLREEYNNAMFNLGMFMVFMVLVVTFLYYKYKTKPTEEDMIQLHKKQQEYILTKLKMVNAANDAISRGNFITGLPKWEVPEVELIKNRKIYL
jgi:hypothetical protein